MAEHTEGPSSVCAVHNTESTAFIIVAPEPSDAQRKEQLFDEFRRILQVLCRGSPGKRIRVSIIGPPGHVDLWEAHNFIAPKVKAIKLDFKEHNIQVSAQKIGQPLNLVERALYHFVCFSAGVKWNGTLAKKTAT